MESVNISDMEDQHTNNGGYGDEGVIWHQHSNLLMQKILEYFPKEVPVVDLGCGHNWYVSVLRHFGYMALGFDLVDLGSVYFNKVDVSAHMILPPEKSNVIALEVGEHIPSDRSKIFIDNVCLGGGDILMSWAVPGQEGIGHINCQTNEWVIAQMVERGYKLDEEKTNYIRAHVKNCHCSWFQNTIMYFICA
jgi:hypothetical protein